MSRKKSNYGLKDGMVLEKTFYGNLYRLRVVKDGDVLKFRVEDKLFNSLTAAARHVVRDETRQIDGPKFWGASND
jgi:hypothetical protein